MTFEGRFVSILPTKGLNNGKSAILIEPDQSPDCQDVRFRTNSVTKRDGYKRYITGSVTSSPVTGIAQFIKSDGTTGQVMFAANDAYRENAGAWSSIKGAVTLTSNANAQFQCAQLTDLLIATNGVDQIVKWTGGAANLAALGGGPPTAATALTTYKNYVLLGDTTEGGTRVRERVRWSDLNAPETWPAANFNIFLNKTGQSCKAFGKIGDAQFVFFDRSIHAFSYTGLADVPFTFPAASPEIGTVSGQSVVPVDWAIFFLGFRGAYLFNGSEPQYIGEDIEGTWRTVNVSRLPFAVGLHNPLYNEVWWSISTGSSTVNNVTIVYDYVKQSWALFNIGFNAVGTFFSTLPLAPMIGGNTGFVYQTNTGLYLDDAAAISAYCKTRPNDFGDPGRRRKVRQIQAVVNIEQTANSIVQFKSAYDLQTPVNLDVQPTTSSGDLWDAALWDVGVWATEGQKIVSSRPPGSGRYFQQQFGNDQASQGLTVSALTAGVKGEAGEGA